MQFQDGMTTKQKIEATQRYVLVHSMLYYHMSTNVITDQQFDKVSKLLADKIKKFGPKKIASTQYGYAFYDFDGTSGFYLMDRLTPKDRKRIKQVANAVLRSYNRGGTT